MIGYRYSAYGVSLIVLYNPASLLIAQHMKLLAVE